MARKLKFLSLFLLLLVSLEPLAALAATNNDFTQVVLKNGITVKYKVMKGEPLVSMYAVFPIGMNKEKTKGIAHLMEHLVFRGGSGYNFQDIAGVTSRQGGNFNGFTSFYTTSYNYVIPKENFEPAFKIFNGSIWKTDLSEPTVALERKIVVHELDMDYAERIAYEPIYKYFFPEVNYSKETVESISIQDLQEFHQSYYQPENATYILAGDFDPETVLKQLEGVSNGYGKKAVTAKPLTEFSLPERDVVESNKIYPYQYQVLMAYEMDNLAKPDQMVLKLLAYIYGSNYLIDYKQNEFKSYYVLSRTLGTKELFGIYYLERNHSFTEQAFNEEKLKMAGFFRQFKKMNFKEQLKNFIELIEMERETSLKSPVDAVEYEVQRLTDSDNITVDDLETLKKLTVKDLERVIDNYLNKPPKTWILVKNKE